MMVERIIWRLVGEMLMVYVNKVELRFINFVGFIFFIFFFFVLKIECNI